jgi:hypothetical protein
MVIEVAYIESRAPDPDALTLLLQRASEHCQKPGGIQLVVDPAIPAPANVGSVTHSVLDLQAFSDAHRQTPSTPNTAVLFIEYVDGQFALNTDVLGAAFGSHSIAVFKDQIATAFGDGATGIEGPVIVHELGHEMGLVNEGTPMVTPHEDLDHPGHDFDPTCVMYWTLHSGTVTPGDVPPNDYCPFCKADLRTAGGN